MILTIDRAPVDVKDKARAKALVMTATEYVYDHPTSNDTRSPLRSPPAVVQAVINMALAKPAADTVVMAHT